MSKLEEQAAIRKKWDEHERNAGLSPRPRWWKSGIVRHHVNHAAYKINSSEKFAFHRYLQQSTENRTFDQAVSVGCGVALNELSLLEDGIVGHFCLYDLSPVRRDRAIAEADRRGLGDRITYHVADAFLAPPRRQYDLVYWHAALHHMLDVRAAVLWSKRSLNAGGVFTFNEFVGPRRFQWPEADLKIAYEARRSVPRSVKAKASAAGYQIKDTVRCPSEQQMIKKDPSESVQSDKILPELNEAFASRDIQPLGGLIYMLALGDVVQFVSSDKERAWLRDWLNIDRGLALAGRTYFASGVCQT